MFDVHDKTQTSPESPAVTLEAKESLERLYRRQLFDALLNQQTTFAGMPYEAHIQYSNYCNMSCIMCWDGRNPPIRRMSPSLLSKVGEQVARHLSVITPYSGSEPLLLTWDDMLAMVRRYGVRLSLTTNLQFLDEHKFGELLPITETLKLSVDSHIPAVFEKIRPQGNSRKVFHNLDSVLQWSRSHSLPCVVNVVLMTQNAPMLADTLVDLAERGAETVDVIQMLDINGRSEFHDPLTHFSKDYLAKIKQDCVGVARSRRMRLIWNLSNGEDFDFRDKQTISVDDRKAWNDRWDRRLKLHFPGYCTNALNRLRIDLDGDVAPCCYAGRGELSLGNLNESDFDEIWNGREARDLRRGMLTGDVPSLCASCRFHEPLPPQENLPFEEHARRRIVENDDGNAVLSDSVELTSPEHASRHESNPMIEVFGPSLHSADVFFAIALGGEPKHLRCVKIDKLESNGDRCRFGLPDSIWKEMQPNTGYWWQVFIKPVDRPDALHQAKAARCLVLHQAMPRVAGSGLRYLDQNQPAVCDLGGIKTHGFENRESSPSRPDVLQARPKKPAHSAAINSRWRRPFSRLVELVTSKTPSTENGRVSSNK